MAARFAAIRMMCVGAVMFNDQIRQIFVLVDWDNFKGRRHMNSRIDAQILLNQLGEFLHASIHDNFNHVQHIDLRLYGGWIDGESYATRRAELVTEVVGEVVQCLRRRWKVPTRISLSRSLSVCGSSVACADHALIGTWTGSGQDMVDGMITADAIHLSLQRKVGIVVVSSDQDLLPGIVLASSYAEKSESMVVWSRVDCERRLNDRIPQDHSCVLYESGRQIRRT
jgi:hypothetical protein